MNHQKHFQEEIIIFTRYPLPGRAKTRLIPELGADGAAAVQRTMTEQIVLTAAQLAREKNLRLSVYHAGGSRRQMEEWLGPGIYYHEQEGKDLGRRMMHALRDAWKRGAERALLIGSDCPGIDAGLLSDAMTALRGCQLVLGPAADGGYYLVGISAELPGNTLEHLFTGIEWGASSVFQATMERAGRAGLAISILKELHDIDHPPDLEHIRHHPDPQ